MAAGGSVSVLFDVKKVADLAQLEFSGDQENQMINHFNVVLKAFDQIKNIPTEGVEPLVTPHEIYPPLREDDVFNVSTDRLMELAPESKDQLYKVPPVV